MMLEGTRGAFLAQTTGEEPAGMLPLVAASNLAGHGRLIVREPAVVSLVARSSHKKVAESSRPRKGLAEGIQIIHDDSLER